MSLPPIPEYKNFDPHFTLGQCGEVFKRHNLPCKSLFHGPDTFDVADALLSLEADNKKLRDLLVESQTSIGGDWRKRRDALLEEIAE